MRDDKQKVLVAIANYGTGNSEYLREVLAAYRAMPIDVSIVVLSDIPKELGKDIEVRVGLPSSNPWSLPFAHRSLFRERIYEFDWFVYSEDDTLMEWDNLKNCIEANGILTEMEIPGFLRKEVAEDESVFFSTCHSHFRWIPNSVRKRGGELWARYSNDHSACFVASREQIIRGIESGGFGENPHEGRFDMLCSAATDLYTACRMEKLICIDRVMDFTLWHLPNKYLGKMGLPYKEMMWQIEALRKVYKGELSADEIADPETGLPWGYGSKRLREEPDNVILDILKNTMGYLVVYGAGDGTFESSLVEEKRKVGVWAWNAVMSECCRNRGLEILGYGATKSDGETLADAIVCVDVLHLVPDPRRLLTSVRSWMKPASLAVFRVPYFKNVQTIRKCIKNKKFFGAVVSSRLYRSLSTSKLSTMMRKAGFSSVEIHGHVPTRFSRLSSLTMGGVDKMLSPYLYVIARKS